jgi:hypothetical protein
MPANINELLQAFSITAQTAIDAPSTNLIRVRTTSSDIADLEPVVESNAGEIGGGSEFETQAFLTNWKATKKVQCYLSSELFAIAAAYGLGSGNAGTYTPIDPVTDLNEINLPLMTLVEAIRPGAATSVFDRAIVGMVVNTFKVTLGSGAGRANSKIEMDLVGTGKFIDPSGITLPALSDVHLLPASSILATINGVDYVTAKTFESFELTWDNKVRDGYFPGSGFQTAGDPTSGQLQGRMEFGTRDLKCFFTARFQHDSAELTKLEQQTAGSAVISLAGATGHGATITMSQCTFKSAKVENANGIVTVRVDLSPQVAASGLLSTLVSISVQNALGTVGR